VTENDLTPLPPPMSGESVYEPHLSIDPANPNRIAAIAMYGCPGARAARSLFAWTTEDAGRAWHGDRVPLPQFDGEGAADPMIAYGANGELLVLGMSLPGEGADAAAAMGRKRGGVLPSTQLQQEWLDNPSLPEGAPEVMCVVRSTDHGRSWDGTIIRNSVYGDKTALAVDTHPSSPHRGNVYVAWSAPFGALSFAASGDAGRTFSPGREISGRYGFNAAQLAVAPDGTVHGVWSVNFFARADAPSDAATAIWHATSGDGGQTFSAPRVVAHHAGLSLAGNPALGIDPSGALLLVWGQASSSPPGVWDQARHQLEHTYSPDGQSWSPVAPLLHDAEPTVCMGLPAVAATATHWYVLTYLAGDTSMEVSLLRSPLADLRFQRHHTLARRGFGLHDISLNGNYALRRCDDIAQVGDYVGLAAHETRVAAAFVLPESDDWASTTTAYAAVRDE
jgi:hypothetical protein